MAHLNGFSIFGGIIFIIVIILVIHPVSLRLPLALSVIIRKTLFALRLVDHVSDGDYARAQESFELDNLSNKEPAVNSTTNVSKRVKITIGLSSAPLLGVLLLLVTTSIGGEQIKKGIAGEHGVRPYDVLVLFISLAYIATALDATGGLRYLAFRVALKAGSGNQLYFYLYFFFFMSGAIIGNDPIVLSGTPFLAYLTRVSGIVPPTAWVFAQFLAANVSSAILVSSNPTNVLVAGAFKLNFLADFTKYTVTPAIVGAVLVYPVLFFGFKSKSINRKIDHTIEGQLIPSTFVKPDVNPKSALVDPQGAIFHTSLLLVTLAVLVGTSFVPQDIGVWMVTAPAAIIGLFRDILNDLYVRRKARSGKQTPPTDDDSQTLKTRPSRITLPSLWRQFQHTLPSTAVTLSRLPWPLLPFAVGMFILVRSLDHLGYIEIFAGWTAKVCVSPAASVFFVGTVVAIGLCPLCGTNIGATILAVEVLSNPSFADAPHVQADPRILQGAIYSVALASNTGALISLPASLAGLLWSRILSQKGIRISQAAFSLINLIPVCVVTFSGLAIILIEILYWG